MNLVLDLFLSFFKIGLFTFGGGYAMIALIEDHCVDKRKWITHDDMMNITVVAESTPGPIAINCATFVGYKQAGVKGAIAATFGVVLPSFIIIYVLSMFLDSFLEITLVANAFKGIKLAVGLLILGAGFRMKKKLNKKPLETVILICACAALLLSDFFALNISTIVMLLLAALVALAVSMAGKGGGKA